jgi:hypothetical protein
MDELDKYVETVRFLMSSTRKLSEAFQESEARVRRGFGDVASDVEDIERRLANVEAQLTNVRDLSLGLQREQTTELPVAPATAQQVIPALNLPVEMIVEVYASAPALLEPFSRPCSVTARTLNGESHSIELEVTTQGNTWSLETAESDWLLIPRPGMLERRHQIQSLERLFIVHGGEALPATIQLVRPAVLESVVAGHRWQLAEKGLLDATPDPTKVSLAGQLSRIEKRLSALEGSAQACPTQEQK